MARLLSRAVGPILTLALATAARAEGEPTPSGRDLVVGYNTGPRLGIAPGVFIPTDGGRAGFSIAGDFRYGFETGPVILAPGARVQGFFLPDSRVVTLYGTGRITLPLGPVGPYVLGGAGPGFVSAPEHVDLAYLAGGGFMVHIGLRFGIGAEATYQAIRGTAFSALSVGPTLLLAF